MDNKQLKEAFGLYHQRLSEGIDRAEVEKVTLSEELEQRMEAELHPKKTYYFSFLNTAVKRAACIVAAVLLITAVTTFSVEALREGFLHFVVELFDGGSTVSLPGEPSDQAPRYLTRIPEGFRLTSKTENDHTMICLYEGENRKNFQFSRHPKGTNITVYTENADCRNITLTGGNEGILFENCGERFLIFNDGNYMYAVIGNLTEEEIVALADTLFETR